ncbi:methyltransferase domain-containing protein [Fulvivirgaceae bacterium PWU4]|uniref:Methyltransferase domain-containing protein n=1 Tax=Chryseosolibacter histidini TaxID=2782349 RepID=A0AAP2GLK0_9BACT|nr:class I SAM-dependent methyltransferase [Chryseosolibacter histidini]MBT1695888.1 methyltransferase domain-containing protein [Chryseosolibacter histidini]
MFNETSYRIQRECFLPRSNEQKKIQKTWFNQNTIDTWRHIRMYTPLTPLLKAFPGTRWLTVGDGRYGLDSVRLKQIEPSLRILPTDLSPYLLEEAKKEAIIEDYRVENAEFLSFQDNEFDFAFCKESYHHFPRPYLAVYEMLRVSKKGIIFIEPNDKYPQPVFRSMLDKILHLMKRTRGGSIAHRDAAFYEPAGNYIYTLSKREVEKVGLGLQLPAVATRYFNDHYEEGVEFEDASDASKLFAKVKKKIAWGKLKCDLGLSSRSNIIACIFKELPDPKTLDLLKKENFEINLLPQNPFLNKS